MKYNNVFAFVYQLLKPMLCALVLCFTTLNARAVDKSCTAGLYIPAGSTTCTQCTANNYCPSGTAYNLPTTSDLLIYSCSSNTGDVYTRSAAGSDAKEDCRGQINLYVNGSSTYPVTFYGTSYTNNSAVKSIHAYYTSSTSYVDGCSWNSTNWCKRKSTDFYMSSLPTSSNVTRSGFTLKGWTVGNADGATYVSTSNKTPKLTGTANLYAQWTKTCSAGYYLQQSNASCVQCPAVSDAQGYYCPGGALVYNPNWSDKGKNSCPPGYPWSEAGNSSINSCYISMYFYPSKNAVFRGATYTSDAQYNGLWNRYKQDNSWFTLVSGTDGQKHMTATLLVGGDNAPTKTGYTFAGWVWQSQNVTSSECTNAGMTLISSNRGCNLNGLSSCPSSWSYYGGVCIPNSKLTAVTASTNISSNSQRNFYAKWTPINYTITYNLNDGACSGTCSPTTYNADQTVSLPTPTKSGYSFAGWCNSSGNNCVTTIPAGTTGNQTYYAKWVPKSCPAGKYFQASASGNNPGCKPCPSGSYCAGFSVNSNPGTANLGLTGTCPSSHPNSYSSSVEGAKTINDCYKTFSDSCSNLAPTSAIWPNGTMAQDSTGTAMQFYGSSDKILYSGCSIPDTRVSTYANSPTTLAELQTAIDNNSYLSCDTGYHPEYVNETYANTDYNIVSSRYRASNDGYNSPNVTGLAPGEWEITLGGGVVKGQSVCSWTGHGGNTGSVLPTISSAPAGPWCWCQVTSFTPTNGSAQPVTTQWLYGNGFGSTISSNTNCETDCASICGSAYYNHDKVYSRYMWATICRATTYNISYVLNSGTQASDPYTTYNGDILPLTLKNPTRTGYTFAGWCDNSGLTQNCSTTKTITAGTTGNKTYYAKWTPISYTITYNLNTGACSGGSCTPTTYTIEDTVTLPTPTKTAYTFAGWYESANFSGSAVATIPAGSTGNKNYYAKWTKDCAWGTYLPAGGTACATCLDGYYCDQSATWVYNPNEDQGLFQCPNGYTNSLQGARNRKNSCWGPVYTYGGTGATFLGNTYATDNTDYTVGMYFATTTAQFTYDSSTEDNHYLKADYLPGGAQAPTKPGYTFVGWYDNPSFTGSAITGSTNILPSSSLYAKWTPNTVNLTWDANGGNSTATNTGSGGSAATCTYDGDITLPNAEPTKTGFSFTGWKLDNE